MIEKGTMVASVRLYLIHMPMMDADYSAHIHLKNSVYHLVSPHGQQSRSELTFRRNITAHRRFLPFGPKMPFVR